MVRNVSSSDALSDVRLLVSLKETGTPNLQRHAPRPRLLAGDSARDRVDEQHRVAAFEVDSMSAEEAGERDALAPRRSREDRSRGPLHEGQALRVREDARCRPGRDKRLALRRAKIVPEVDERFGE